MNGRLTTIKLSGSITKFSYKRGFEKFALADGRGRDIEGNFDCSLMEAGRYRDWPRRISPLVSG